MGVCVWCVRGGGGSGTWRPVTCSLCHALRVLAPQLVRKVLVDLPRFRRHHQVLRLRARASRGRCRRGRTSRRRRRRCRRRAPRIAPPCTGGAPRRPEGIEPPTLEQVRRDVAVRPAHLPAAHLLVSTHLLLLQCAHAACRRGAAAGHPGRPAARQPGPARRQTALEAGLRQVAAALLLLLLLLLLLSHLLAHVLRLLHLLQHTLLPHLLRVRSHLLAEGGRRRRRRRRRRRLRRLRLAKLIPCMGYAALRLPPALRGRPPAPSPQGSARAAGWAAARCGGMRRLRRRHAGQRGHPRRPAGSPAAAAAAAAAGTAAAAAAVR